MPSVTYGCLIVVCLFVCLLSMLTSPYLRGIVQVVRQVVVQNNRRVQMHKVCGAVALHAVFHRVDCPLKNSLKKQLNQSDAEARLRLFSNYNDGQNLSGRC